MKQPRARTPHAVRIATWPQVRTIAVRAAAAACCVSEGTVRRWTRGTAPASANLYVNQVAHLAAEVLRLRNAIHFFAPVVTAAPGENPHG